MEQKRILVVCVDRDADVTIKTGETGPIVGREKILQTAVKLGLADPAEADTNALFQAVNIADDLKKKGMEVEVAALIGDNDVGITSDMVLSKQLKDVLGIFENEGVVLVSDGAEDEHILPIIQSMAKVISVNRLVVKQSEQLESTYYVIQDFLKEVVNDPKLSRLLIGVPGIAAILFMLFPQHGWRLIVGVTGVFLLVKGFGLESYIQKSYEELKQSLLGGKVSFFTYVVAALIAVVGLVSGYSEVSARAIPSKDIAIIVPLFITRSVDLLMLSAIVALIGKIIDTLVEGKAISRYFLLIIFTIALRLIIDAVSLFLLGEITILKFAVSIILGLTLSIFSFSSIIAVRRPAATKGS